MALRRQQEGTTLTRHRDHRSHTCTHKQSPVVSCVSAAPWSLTEPCTPHLTRICDCCLSPYQSSTDHHFRRGCAAAEHHPTTEQLGCCYIWSTKHWPTDFNFIWDAYFFSPLWSSFQENVLSQKEFTNTFNIILYRILVRDILVFHAFCLFFLTFFSLSV